MYNVGSVNLYGLMHRIRNEKGTIQILFPDARSILLVVCPAESDESLNQAFNFLILIVYINNHFPTHTSTQQAGFLLKTTMSGVRPIWLKYRQDRSSLESGPSLGLMREQ